VTAEERETNEGRRRRWEEDRWLDDREKVTTVEG
jgi:hypothetical protein